MESAGGARPTRLQGVPHYSTLKKFADRIAGGLPMTLRQVQSKALTKTIRLMRWVRRNELPFVARNDVEREPETPEDDKRDEPMLAEGVYHF